VSRRTSAYAVALLAVITATALLYLPVAASASSGGGSVSSGSGSSSSSSGTSTHASVQPGNVVVSASGSGMTIETTASTFLRNRLVLSGNAPAGDAGATVEIQRLGHETGWQWVDTASSTVARGGSFAVVWNTNHIGRFALRAVIASAHAARAAVASPSLTVTVYRPSVATQYGPGFWGHRTACGQVLRKPTLGVANRTLPCGTPVAVYYRGRSIIVPVIDRGPYANGADWDLTQATAHALGIGGTATVGAVSLPAPPSH
jgi:peptidoglycan lytic transglycosylase